MAKTKQVSFNPLKVRLCPREICPPMWLSVNGRLYLAVEWKNDYMTDADKSLLTVVDFWGVEPKTLVWNQSDELMVDVVAESSVLIEYALAHEKIS